MEERDFQKDIYTLKDQVLGLFPKEEVNETNDKMLGLFEKPGMKEAEVDYRQRSDYDPKFYLKMVSDDIDDLSVTGAEILFDIEYDKRDPDHVQKFKYTRNLWETIRDEFKKDIVQDRVSRQRKLDKRDSDWAEYYNKNLLPYKVTVESQFYNQRKNTLLKPITNTIFEDKNIRIRVDSSLTETEVVLPLPLYQSFIQNPQYRRIIEQFKVVPYLTIRAYNDVTVALKIATQTSSGDNIYNVSENTYQFLSNIKIENYQMTKTQFTPLAASLVLSPIVKKVVVRTMKDHPNVTVDPSSVQYNLKTFTQTFYCGQLIQSFTLEYIVAKMFDVTGQEVPFGIASNLLNVQIIEEKTDLYVSDNIWDQYN